MDCPKCNKRMLAVTYRSLQIDRCPECQGVWLDRSELDSNARLVQRAGV